MPSPMRIMVFASSFETLRNKIARADREHDERGRQVRRREHVRETVRESSD